mmetsp:Transcript_18120/g.41746  ORF Transcript_18120/g.41746 Transcript_18120/m.41746 type:complete len:234 (-) Transcript_18120:88-789(-)
MVFASYLGNRLVILPIRSYSLLPHSSSRTAHGNIDERTQTQLLIDSCVLSQKAGAERRSILVGWRHQNQTQDVGNDRADHPTESCYQEGSRPDSHDPKRQEGEDRGGDPHDGEVPDARVVKEPAHVKGGDVGLGAQNHDVVVGEICDGDRPQEDPRDGPEPPRHGAVLVTERVLDASRERFRDPQKPVNGEGHGLAHAEGPFDTVGRCCHSCCLDFVLTDRRSRCLSRLSEML